MAGGYGGRVAGRTQGLLEAVTSHTTWKEAVNSFKRLSNRFIIATVPLFFMLAWHAEAIAAQLTVTWGENSTDETVFSVERSTGATGTFEEVGVTAARVTTCVDLALADATTYCYRARAFDTVEYSDYSNTACATTIQALGLAVVKMGAGSGMGISTPSGIICGASALALSRLAALLPSPPHWRPVRHSLVGAVVVARAQLPARLPLLP